MKCEKCGFENPDNSKFCCQCGTKMPVNNECPKCHTTFPSYGRFCPNCGTQLRVESKDKSNTLEIVQYPEGLEFIVGSCRFKMIRVDGGTFTVGATNEQGGDAYSDELPTHQVTLSDYYIGQTEVTQALWEAVMGESVTQIANREGWSTVGVGVDYPMYCISYDDCTTFVNKLNTLFSSQLGGKRFALPTEAQWEFAARGGNKSKGYKYAGSNYLDEVAWYRDNSGSNTHPVAQKRPNELGLYDMSGNVLEWCEDWKGSYSSNAQTNPKGPTYDSYRVIRGGSWGNLARNCRVSIRGSFTPDYRNYYVGLRLCLLP